MKKASLLTMEMYNKVFKNQLMETIDADRKVKHTKMTGHIEEALKDKKKLLGIDPTNVESCYPPIIQSGKNFSAVWNFIIKIKVELMHSNTLPNRQKTVFILEPWSRSLVYATKTIVQIQFEQWWSIRPSNRPRLIMPFLRRMKEKRKKSQELFD